MTSKMISAERAIAACNELKKVLQNTGPEWLERLVAGLIGRLQESDNGDLAASPFKLPI